MFRIAVALLLLCLLLLFLLLLFLLLFLPFLLFLDLLLMKMKSCRGGEEERDSLYGYAFMEHAKHSAEKRE